MRRARCSPIVSVSSRPRCWRSPMRSLRLPRSPPTATLQPSASRRVPNCIMSGAPRENICRWNHQKRPQPIPIRQSTANAWRAIAPAWLRGVGPTAISAKEGESRSRLAGATLVAGSAWRGNRGCGRLYGDAFKRSGICALAITAGLAVTATASPAAAAYWYGGGWFGSGHKHRHTHKTEKAKAADRASKETSANTPKGPLQIFISINQQKLHLYGNGVHVADTSIATGVPSHPTPFGVFSVIQKQVFHRSNIYSNAPMPYMQRITWSGVAMHEGKDI